MNKKKSLFGIISAFIILRLIPLVSAYSGGYGFVDLRQGSDQVIQWIQDFATPFFEIMLDTNSGEFFFAKCLMLLLLFILIFFILEKSKIFGDKKGVISIVSAVVSILAMRYIPESDLISGILLPYSVLGVALLTYLPFMIYFFFVYQSVQGNIARRIAWIIYAAVFGVLAFLRKEEISPAGTWIYVSGLILVILSLLLDGTIKKLFEEAKLNASFGHLNDSERVRLLRRFQEAKQVYDSTGDNSARREMERLAKALRINTSSQAGGNYSI